MKPFYADYRFYVSLAIPQIAGFVGSFFTRASLSDWYQYLERPVFSPPNWIFGPVWTLLFVMMGLALFLVWRRHDPPATHARAALYFFGIQMGLNVLWSVLFFGLRSPLYAFVEIIVLWLCILITIVLFYRASKLAAWFMVPYVLWVSFAAVLNFAFYWLNR